MDGGTSNRRQLIRSTKENKWMPLIPGLIAIWFSTFFESNLVFVVAYGSPIRHSLHHNDKVKAGGDSFQLYERAGRSSIMWANQ